jgi:hypothetical protein
MIKEKITFKQKIAIATTRSVRPYIFILKNHGKNFSFGRRK